MLWRTYLIEFCPSSKVYATPESKASRTRNAQGDNSTNTVIHSKRAQSHTLASEMLSICLRFLQVALVKFNSNCPSDINEKIFLSNNEKQFTVTHFQGVYLGVPCCKVQTFKEPIKMSFFKLGPFCLVL